MTFTITNPLGSLFDQQMDLPQSVGYGARIGTTWVRLAASPDHPFRLYTRDSIAGRQSDTSNVYENVLDLGFVFARQDLSGGEGLDFYPRPFGRQEQELDETRYFDSKNLDISQPLSGDQHIITLSNDYELWYTGANPIGDLAVGNDKLYVAVGDTVHYFDDFTDATSDGSQQLVAAQDIIQLEMTRSGLGVALLANDAMYVKPIGTETWTAIPNTANALDNPQAFWLVKDRLILWANDTADAGGSELREVDMGLTGTPATPTFAVTFDVFDTFDADCNNMIDAGTAILAATTDGYIRSYVPQTDTAGGAPALTIRGKTRLPRGDIPYAMYESAGRLFILSYQPKPTGTNQDIRAYNAEVLDERFDFVVGQLTLVREWLDAKEAAQLVSHVAGGREDIMWTVHEADDNTYLWKQDLITTGLFRHAQVFTTGDVRGLVYWRNKELFYNDDEVYRTAATYFGEGWLITPNINFGLNTDINWIASMVQATNIQDGGGAQVELYLSTDVNAINDVDHVSWGLITRISNQNAAGIENPLLGVTGKQAALKLRVLGNNSNQDTPQVTRFAVRGFPQHRDWIMELPVNVSDYIEVPGRKPYRIPGWGDKIHNAMLNLQGEHLEVTVYDPPFEFRGMVDNVLEPVEYMTHRGSVGRVMMMQLRGNRATGSVQTTGDAGLGIGLLGVVLLGSGQTGATVISDPFTPGFDEGFE